MSVQQTESTESQDSTVSAEPAEFPFVLARATVERVEVLSPSFVRIEFGGEEMRGFGTPGRSYDQRIKLIFPGTSGELPELREAGEEWYQHWLALPEAERGSMRTYSIRDLEVSEDGSTRLFVDFVLHLVPGLTGPASSWAAGAAPGDQLLVFGPRNGMLERGGIEYEPGAASTVLLAGDETAAPAIARIIEDLGAAPGSAPEVHAFIEVPEARDVLAIDVFEGAKVTWLPREGAGTGTKLISSVLQHLGARSDGELDDALEIVDVEGEETVWETPQFSRLGEQTAVGENHAESYFWIAGESGTVTTLRRHLVRDLGISRGQVAFMGYWRHGVAMKG
jgi:NADPH-dependent ferric siderophore reductase